MIKRLLKRFAFGIFAATIALAGLPASSVGIINHGSRYAVPPPPPAGNEVTTLSLTSTVGGSNLPFMVGQAFKKGDVASGSDIVTDTAGVTLRSVCKRRWSDASCKHFVLVGTFNGSAGVPKSVSLKTGTATTGTALTCADIATAAPTASVAITGVGTVNLSTLLAAPFRTWISTPEMVECHYRSAVGSDTDLAAWFYVRMWAGGSTKFIRAAVENGYLGGSPTNETHAVTVTIGGSTPINGASITQYPWTRYDATGWIGTDPQVYLAQNTTYLISTKLVPNFASYARAGASSTVLNAFDLSYVPMDSGDFPTTLGGTGGSDWIGPVPQTDALCVTSADARACNASDVATRSLNIASLARRASATNVNARPTDFGSTTYNSGNGCGGSHGDIINDGFNWDVAHAPKQGYVSYLRSGDFYYLETLGNAAQAYYGCASNAGGSGVNKTLRRYQPRAVGWGFNIIGSWLAIYPLEGAATADSNVHSSYLTWFQNVITDFASTVGVNQIGLPWAFSVGEWDYDAASSPVGAIPPWMYHFWISSEGMLFDTEALSSETSLVTLSTDMFKFPVGLLGPTGTSNYYYAYAGRYGLFVDPTDGPGSGDAFNVDADDFLDNFGTVFSGTTGFANSGLTTNTLSGDSGSNPALSDGYWNNLKISLDAAVNRHASGADAAYLRLTGASNWPPAGSGTNTCNNKPNYCTEPWTIPTANTALSIAAATLSANQSLKFGSIPSGVIAPDGAPTTMYGSSGVYDPIRKEVRYVGKRNSNGSGYQFLVYAEATDTWSTNRALYPGATDLQSGHGYDHNAIDPATGDHYDRPYGETVVWKWNGSWTSLTAMPNKNDAASITWFPSVGLIYTDCQRIRKFSGGSWTDIATGFSGGSQNHIVSEYNRTANVIIFGSGNCFDTMRKMTSTEVITTIATPPFSVSSSELDGLLASVPNEDRYVGWEKTTSNWIRYDISDDAWTTLTQSVGSGASPQTGTPNISGFTHCINTTIDELDVIEYVCGSGTGAGEVWLYKH